MALVSSKTSRIILQAFLTSSSEIIRGGAIRRQKGENKNQSVNNPFSKQS